MNNYFSRGFLSAATIAIIAGFATTAEARQLSPEEALMRARRVDATVMSPMTAGSPSAPTLEYTATTADGSLNTLYLFNSPANGGYLLVSADDSSDAALLGYSTSGRIDASSMPENMRWWISQYSKEIASASLRDGSTFDYGDFEIPELPAIEPLVKTHWAQRDPYNIFCPTMSNGNHAVTGCVATAMAQVMKVHQWPEKGVSSHSYTPPSIGKLVTVNFADSTYRWDLMLDKYTSTSTYESQAAVASLMVSCGVSVGTNYSTSSSAGYTSAAKALVNYFNYDKGVRILHRDYYGMEDWFDLVYSELAAGRPVLYSGTNESAGHAFVCDGYSKDGYFHINWGYGGGTDGYFMLTNLNAGDTGIGGVADGYNNGQAMIVGIQPPVEGSTVIPVMEFYGNFSTSQSGYSRSDATVHIIDRKAIFCESVATVKATMGLKITDDQGTVSYAAAPTTTSYSSGQGFTGYNVETSGFPTGEGHYQVAPAVRDEQGKWWDCDVKMTANRYLDLTITADSLLFTPSTVARVTATDVEVLSPIYAGRQCAFRAVLTNNSDEEFYERVAPTLVLDHVDKAQCDPVSVQLLPGQSGVFEWIGDFPASVTPGDYLMWLVDGNSLDVSTEGLPVTVLAAPKTADSFTLTTTTMDNIVPTEDSPEVYAPDKLTFRVNVDVAGGYFGDDICGCLYHANGSGIVLTGYNYIAAGEGSSASADFEFDASRYCTPGNIYYVRAEGADHGRMGNNLYFTVDPLAGITSIGEDSSVLTANESGDELLISSPSPMSALILYSADGAEVMKLDNIDTDTATLNVASLPAGLYILSASLPGHGLQALKIALR
ncbi:MAG: C10 family peptidase [Paramuribaculum sp.]|nr:C10 family peptidase [Paramuribaculum sp.]